jgi:serine/threonine-protein kinase
MLPFKTDPFIPLREALKGRYQLERELGRSGMGIVYLAHELALDRPVALKLLPPAAAKEARRRERFLREARTAALLSHPNIVPIFAVDEVGEFVFFTMAYVEGETLARRVRVRGPLPAGEATRVLREVGWAVAYAHAQGVIHRDLKAENILLERGSGRVLVTDFGIAHVRTQPEITGEGKIVGTVAYMSPEQARGQPVDERSDVYSLGVAGYFAASGRLPFPGTTAAEILEQKLNRPPPPLATGGREVDGALARAVDRSLAKEPERRFQTAAELADALEVGRELPVPLRAFLRRVRYVSQSHARLTLLGVLALGALIGALLRAQWGEAGIVGGFIALVIAAPIAFLLPVTRRVLKAGCARADIMQALRADLDRQREELAFQYGRDASPTERIAHRAAYAGFGLFGVGAAMALLGTGGADLVVGTMSLGILTTVSAGVVAGHRYQRRRALAGERWLKFWNSRVGAWAARLAGLGLKRLPAGAAPASRRTETAIAMAADRLFQELPQPARNALEDLPGVLNKMELQTLGTRTWIAQLETTAAGDQDAPDRELAEARDGAQQRLAETVTALETIRLELSRFHEGTGSLESLKAELTAAREITRAVDRVLARRREIRMAPDQGAAVWSGGGEVCRRLRSSTSVSLSEIFQSSHPTLASRPLHVLPYALVGASRRRKREQCPLCGESSVLQFLHLLSHLIR